MKRFVRNDIGAIAPLHYAVLVMTDVKKQASSQHNINEEDKQECLEKTLLALKAIGFSSAEIGAALHSTFEQEPPLESVKHTVETVTHHNHPYRV